MVAGMLSGLEYRQADVFAEAPLAGNGLSVFFDCGHLDGGTMQALTREMRQFESIFLMPGAARKSGSASVPASVPANNPANAPDIFRARLFTMEEELDFAGHPVLGAAAALHDRLGGPQEQTWTLELNARAVPVVTRRVGRGVGTGGGAAYEAEMDQGLAAMGPPLTEAQAAPYLAAMHLQSGDVAPGLPLQVVSTGLPYLILPIVAGLDRCRVEHRDFEALLAKINAKFAYVLHVPGLEGRTWDNAGLAEDAATGSAAGPVGAYLAQHGRIEPGRPFTLQQGRFVHRPSTLRVTVEAGRGGWLARVAGRVVMVAAGRFD